MWKGNKKGKKTLESNGAFCLSFFLYTFFLINKHLFRPKSNRFRAVLVRFELNQSELEIQKKKKKKRRIRLERVCSRVDDHIACLCVSDMGAAPLELHPCFPGFFEQPKLPFKF